MYRKHENGGVLRLSDGAYIPNDVRNVDWAEFLTWCETNEPLPAEPTPMSLHRARISAESK
jgi:hypothetical protein